MMKKMKSIARLSGIAFAAAFSGLLTACGGGNQQQMGGMPAEVETQKVVLGNANLEESYPASIKGRKDVEIRPQISGFITKVCVDEGQMVSAGQTLFIIDQVQLEAAVRSAEAAVVAAKSQVATAQLTANNKKALYEKNIISEYEYQTAALALESAKAAQNQASQSLVNAKKNLSYSVVTAPFAGVVGSIPNREGSLAGPSMAQPLTTLSDISEVYAYFSLTERDVLRLTEGGSCSLAQAIAKMPEVSLQLSDGTRYALTGRVSTVSGVLDQSTGSASVRALFKNNNGMLRSGSTGNVLIPQPSQDLIIIPQRATYEIQDMKYVYVVGDSSKAVARNIKVSPVDDGKTFIVTEGLSVGDEIVVEGVGTAVKAGTVIKPKAAAAPAAAQGEEKK
ncbi:MAG: efflux RND transporter periplasmic adaptor subunit [Bacteroidales bacterium]|nr:efflux RND transporter periplasmic adaptor subunit [Bacteroidales bacterium]